jgi:hypothetical protein
MPTHCDEQAPVPPPSYYRAQAQRARALRLHALTLIQTLHLLALCRLAVQLAHRRCPPPLPKGPGGSPRTYRDESLLLIALLKTLWRLSRPGTCMTGSRAGPRWPWPVACLWGTMVSHAFPALPNYANAGKRLEPRSLRPSLCSRFGEPCTAV